MNDRLRVFVSSVQKELENERVTVQSLLETDSFLKAHAAAVLYELEPASHENTMDGCLKALDGCQAYVLIVGSEYGTIVNSVSITHAEYRRAKARGLPILAFIKGDSHAKREPGTADLLKELRADGFKYKRFGNVIELQREVRAALVKLLKEHFRIAPSSDEDAIAGQTIEATSPFEAQAMTRLRWAELDRDIVRRLLVVAEGRDTASLGESDLLAGALLRGLVWTDPASGEHFATAAGTVLLAPDPSVVFPHCRVLADAYRGTEPDGTPNDHADLRGPMPMVIDQAIAFVQKNTRHPMRVVGATRVTLDEYPVEALREALVNAVAHRDYEDGGRKVLLEVFADRVLVSSPGKPPAPITLAKLRAGKYKPCSRNPVLAQCLSYFHRIEERGSGFRRMNDMMLDHGLDRPLLGTDTGYFQVTFAGPGDDLDRIQGPAVPLRLAPSLEAQLNERQRGIMKRVLQHGSVTRRWCVAKFDVANDTAGRDLKQLTELRLLVGKGRGRSVSYGLGPAVQATDNRPT